MRRRPAVLAGSTSLELSYDVHTPGTALLAVQVDPVAAMRLVDIGPGADSGKAADAFRAFWGPKAELRRFQDGNIAEAVAWECGPSQRHLIVDRCGSVALSHAIF